MRCNRYSIILVVGFVLFGAVPFASATPTHWTDWTSITPGTPPSVSGTITLPDASVVTVTYHGEIFFAQIAGGTDYWTPSAPYMSAVVDNAPPASDIIALAGGNTDQINTITFSQPVTDPVMAIVSLGNGSTSVRYAFDTPFDILSVGPGYWGAGPLVEQAGNVLVGTEGHGTIQFQGAVTSIGWMSPDQELWHGFTVGLVGVPGPAEIPSPGAILLGSLGVFLVGVAGRRRLL